MNIFQRQNFACEFYAFINNWMIATGKELPDKLVKIKLNIDNLNETYTKVNGIIDEILGSCYFNNIESLLESIFNKTLH